MGPLSLSQRSLSISQRPLSYISHLTALPHLPHLSTDGLPLRGPENDKGAKAGDDVPELLSGWRLYGVALTCQLCIFLANLEVAIVSTTLVSITDGLQSFDRSSWVITSYLLTYTGATRGFLVIWSKISDSLGRRQCLCTAIAIFTVASGACGAAQSSNQLIIFRSFQGIGGSGLLSLNFVILPELVEQKQYAKYAALTSCAFVLGFLFGPILGGVIVGSTTWRWVFLLNLPLGGLALALLMTFMPVGFPDINATRGCGHFSRLKEIDFAGSVLFLGACAFVVSALEEEGDGDYSWSSCTISVLLMLSAMFVVALPVWEARLDRSLGSVQAIFPWRLMTHRVFMAALLITFFAGTNFTVSVIQIPQQWQTVSRTTALVAGVRLLPFTLFYSVGTVLSAVLASRLQVPAIFVVLMGAFLQTIATSVMAFTPVQKGPGKYICEGLLGIGVGENLGVLVQLTPQLIRGRDQAVSMGAIAQFRALGGVVGFAITTNVFNSYVRTHLAHVLESTQLDRLFASFAEATASMSPDLRGKVTAAFANAYDLEIAILVGMSVAQAVGVGLLWEREFRRLI